MTPNTMTQEQVQRYLHKVKAQSLSGKAEISVFLNLDVMARLEQLSVKRPDLGPMAYIAERLITKGLEDMLR